MSEVTLAHSRIRRSPSGGRSMSSTATGSQPGGEWKRLMLLQLVPPSWRKTSARGRAPAYSFPL